MKKWHLVLIAVTTLVLASCGGGVQGDSIQGAWHLETGTFEGDPVPMVATHPITLTIEEDRFGGTAACNGYGGTYTLDGDRISFSAFAVTEMACFPQEVMESESAYLQALLGVDTVLVEGERLTLSGDRSELVFNELPPVPTADLQDTVWVLDGLIQGDAVSSVSGERATLELFGDGSLIGSTGCRTLTGSYVVSGAEVQFTDFAARGECSQALQFQDNLLVTVLGDGFRVSIDGDTLTLTIAGDEGLIYKAES